MDGRDPRVDKHELLLEKLVEQQVRFEEMMKVQIRRADIQEEALKKKAESDTIKDIEMARTLEAIKVSVNLVKWVAGIVGGFLLVYLLQHIFIK